MALITAKEATSAAWKTEYWTDLSDCWEEETGDDENLAAGFFCEFGILQCLIVTEGELFTLHDRSETIKLIGYEAVSRAEQWMSDASVNDHETDLRSGNWVADEYAPAAPALAMAAE